MILARELRKVKMQCKYCGGIVNKKGIRRHQRRVKCRVCGKYDTVPLHEQSPNILLLDIETTPMKVFVWGLFGNKYINHENVIEDWNVLSWAAKWLCDSKVMGQIQTPSEARSRDDKRILKQIWGLIDKADIIIAHNAKWFDIKKLNTRFYLNGFPPPRFYKTIDTLLEARKNFSFSSNKLDYLSKIIKNKKKNETNFKLWTECLDGNSESLRYMMKYNKKDVKLLEEVYIELRPWIKSHPNSGIYMEKDNVCPTCGSEDIFENNSYYTTSANKYKSYRCKSCGALSRSMRGELNIDKRRNLPRSLAA